jgi:hypothetical protein
MDQSIMLNKETPLVYTEHFVLLCEMRTSQWVKYRAFINHSDMGYT